MPGADAWHLAVGLWMAIAPQEFRLLTLDRTQAELASRLGFDVIPSL